MRFTKWTLAMVIGLAMASVFSGVARASNMETANAVSFSQPVAIPGMVLPAGSYLFTADGFVVQIWDKDQSTLYATLLTNSADRSADNDRAEFTLSKGASGAPDALHAWFFDGRELGREFIY